MTRDDCVPNAMQYNFGMDDVNPHNTLDHLSQALDLNEYTILIVDDTPTNLGVLFEMLDKYGFEVMVAQDGESGLEKAHYDPPDLILLDILMTGLDGFETCRRLKSSEITQAIPVIFMTALTNTEDKIRGFAVGAVDYVTKPIQQEELLVRVVTHLRLRDLTRQFQDSNEQLKQEITERERVEAELREYRDHLEELVQQRTFELSAANNKLRKEMQERLQAETEIRQQSQQLRALGVRLAEVEEKERRRLARELHDRVGQELGALDVNMNIMRAQLAQGKVDALNPRIDDSLQLLKKVAKQVYDVMADLRSPVLDDYGLVAALNWYSAQFATRTGMNIVVRGEEDAPRLLTSEEGTLFRIAQEALTNVARHAQASQVTITVEQDSTRVRLTIADNGVGFEPAQLTTPIEGRGWGIISMTERAEAIGGYCKIQSNPGQGTLVIVEVAQ